MITATTTTPSDMTTTTPSDMTTGTDIMDNPLFNLADVLETGG
jgi:hypothetical protein